MSNCTAWSQITWINSFNGTGILFQLVFQKQPRKTWELSKSLIFDLSFKTPRWLYISSNWSFCARGNLSGIGTSSFSRFRFIYDGKPIPVSPFFVSINYGVIGFTVYFLKGVLWINSLDYCVGEFIVCGWNPDKFRSVAGYANFLTFSCKVYSDIFKI